MHCKDSRSRGQVIVLVGVLMFLFFGLGAMSVDLIYAYVVKAKLVTAVDAAALAACRALALGSTLPEQQAAVNSTVTKLFDVNFPVGLLLTTARSWTTPTITDNGNATRSIYIRATATVPTFFMRAAGYTTLPVSAEATATRRDVNLILVLDRSGSLVLVSPPAWDDVQTAAKYFVDNFDNTRDKVGLVSFGSTARLDFAPATNFKASINSRIDAMQSYSASRTNSPYGLWVAYSALAALPSTGALNVIAFFTDGQPTAFTNRHTVKTSGTNPKCAAGSSPKDGVYFTQQTSVGTWGIFQKNATANPTGDPDHTVVTGCGLAANGSDGEDLVTAFLSSWRPNGASTTPNFPIATGPKSVSTANVSDGANVVNIAYNLTLQVAAHARQSTQQIRVYSIGLGGYLYPADDVLLEAVANDPASATYVSSEPTGLYAYAPDQTRIIQAFQRIASEITRLVQ